MKVGLSKFNFLCVVPIRFSRSLHVSSGSLAPVDISPEPVDRVWKLKRPLKAEKILHDF